MSNKNVTGRSPYNSFSGARPVAHNQQKKKQLKRTGQIRKWVKNPKKNKLPLY